MTRKEVSEMREAAIDIGKIADRFAVGSHARNAIKTAVDMLWTMARHHEQQINASEAH